MITLPEAFKNDIQGQNTALTCKIQINPTVSDLDSIYLSTRVMEFGGVLWKPLILDVPSISEGIDFENRNYKISNITVKLSNMPYNNEKFSDILGQGSLLNEIINIVWQSPSAIGWTDYLSVYSGIIRKIDHDSKVVTLTVEDRTQADMHKDLPLPENWLGDGNEVPEKYRNKPIPMVYGHVDKSPCVISSYSSADDSTINPIIIACDEKPLAGTINHNFKVPTMQSYIGSLYCYISDNYHSIPDTAQWGGGQVVSGSLQYEFTDNYYELIREWDIETGEPITLGGKTMIEIRAIRKPVSAAGFFLDGENLVDTNLGYPAEVFNIESSIDDNSGTYARFQDPDNSDMFINSSVIGYKSIRFTIEPLAIDDIYCRTYLLRKFYYEETISDINNNIDVLDGFSGAGSELQLTLADFANEATINYDNYFTFSGSTIDSSLDGYWDYADKYESWHLGVRYYAATYNKKFIMRIYGAAVYQNIILQGIIDKDFYANVSGRVDIDGVYVNPLGILIIYDIQIQFGDWVDTDQSVTFTALTNSTTATYTWAITSTTNALYIYEVTSNATTTHNFPEGIYTVELTVEDELLGVEVQTKTFQVISEEAAEIIVGDLNEDGVINIIDIVMLVELVMGGE